MRFTKVDRTHGAGFPLLVRASVPWAGGAYLEQSQVEKQMSDHKLLVMLLLSCMCMAVLAPGSARAAEGYDSCTGFIDALPATITTPGTWCLRKDLATSISVGDAIRINFTNNVTIDCNGFKVGGLGAGLGTWAIGIAAQESSNVTVRHCNVRGFFIGLYLQGSAGRGHVVEDNRLDNNTTIGIFLEGDNSIVRRNLVMNTGPSAPGNGNTPSGIATIGTVDIIGNTVSGVVAWAGSDAWVSGISSYASMGGSMIGNRVRGLLSDGTGSYWGMSANGENTRVTLRDNDIGGNGKGYGISCGHDQNTHRAAGNVINGFEYPLQCGDAGGNDIGY